MPLSREVGARLATTLIGLSSPHKRLIALSADVLMVLASSYVLCALFLRQPIPPQEVFLSFILPAPLFVLPALHVVGVYDAMIRFWSGNQVFRVLAGTLLGMASLGCILLLASSLNSYWNMLVLQGIVVFMSLSWLRFVASSLLRPVTHGVKSERVLIYGAGRAGSQLASALMASGEYWPVAFADDRRDLTGRLAGGLRVYAPDNLAGLRDRLKFTRVLLAMPSASASRRAAIVRSLEPLALKVMVMPGLDELACGRKQVGELRDVQVEDLLGREPVCPDTRLMEAFIKDKSVLITGAGGSIGSELCRQVLMRGASRLVLFEVSELALYQIERELQGMASGLGCSTEIIAVLGNVLDKACVERAMLRHTVQTVYHAAAYKHVPLVEQNVLAGALNNIMGAQIVVDVAVRSRVENFVLVSSDKAVRPTSVMGATKRMQELIVQATARSNAGAGMNLSMVRFGNVLASSGSVVPLFREQIKRGGPVTVTHPDVTRYFMTIPEAAQLVIQAGAMGSRGDIFVLDMGEPVRISDLARKMIHLSGFHPREANGEGDIEIVYSGLRPGEKLYEELLIDASAQPTPHPRIQRAQEPCLRMEELTPKIGQMRQAIEQERPEIVIELLRELVSGYGAAVSVKTPVVTLPMVEVGETIVETADRGESLAPPRRLPGRAAAAGFRPASNQDFIPSSTTA
ncbi:nucleoside-diphosphate sugar epimerase/dehydratase [Solimonas sp. SE-A11]|uniref:polysaccharide biosynthesis protein n=1 Tax=Solimonas sp. SE-A11 TaxID=3054954 RepID=UPI00259D0B36|nr:nucleoside-diphosphate sugar epimerase/dehydratase [Solimonas sp. SE-A11]MDM4769730.1 nucleoside-diphosphate sugar epimerase/dehydratase [Solimonas sp. SE-A11]